jgi:hypothetical protein
MADPVPLAPGIPAVPPNPTSYRDYYQDDGNDKALGNYGTIMNTFMVSLGAAAAPAPNLVNEAVFASAVVDPQAFAMLVLVSAAHPNGRVCLYHRLQHYAPQLGAPTDFDNIGYAFFSDLTNRQAPPIRWEWCRSRVPQREILDQLLVAEPESELVGPFGNDNAGTEDVVHVRQAMLVPFHYVHPTTASPYSPRSVVAGCWCDLQRRDA